MDMHQEMDLQLFADAGTLVNAGGNYVNAYTGEKTAFPEGGGMTALPAGAMALCRNGKLTLLPPEPPLGPMPLEPGENFWGEYTISVRKTTGNFSQKRDAILLNCDKINGALSVRPYRGADRLTLPGSRGGRSVKRLLADRGVPPEKRGRIPVLCVGDRPAALWGVGTDVEFLPEKTGLYTEITVSTNGGNHNG